MDSRSCLDCQRARLRERLQDLSAQFAAELPSGGVAGGVQEGLPHTPMLGQIWESHQITMRTRIETMA